MRSRNSELPQRGNEARIQLIAMQSQHSQCIGLSVFSQLGDEIKERAEQRSEPENNDRLRLLTVAFCVELLFHVSGFQSQRID